MISISYVHVSLKLLTRMRLRSSASFEWDRCLSWTTPALSPLCVQAFWCFVSHLVKEPMSPYQPWSQVPVVRTTKPTNHSSKMHFFKGSPCGNVWNQSLVIIPKSTVGFYGTNRTVLYLLKPQMEGWNFKFQTAPHFCIKLHLLRRVDRRAAIVSCGRG